MTLTHESQLKQLFEAGSVLEVIARSYLIGRQQFFRYALAQPQSLSPWRTLGLR
ncbi:MAG: hypothetical protein AAF889_01520 [Cyanobacteria bacterium P01_D01_bin.73]